MAASRFIAFGGASSRRRSRTRSAMDHLIDYAIGLTGSGVR